MFHITNVGFHILDEGAMKTPLFPFSNIIHVGVGLGHLILVAVLGVSFWSLHQAVNSFESVSHSREITTGLFRLFVSLKKAEDLQHGFLLSGDTRFLTSYRQVVKQIQNGMTQLQGTTVSKNPDDTRLQNFYTMIEKRLNLLQTVLDHFTAQGPQAVREGVLKGIEIQVMNDIQNFILAMSEDDSSSLQNLHTAAHDMESLTLKTMILGILLTLITGLITLWKLRQDLLDRQHLQRRVLEEAKLAEVSRLIGDISHDIKNMLTPVQMGMTLLEDELKEFFRGLSMADQNTRQQAQSVCAEVISMTRRGTGRVQERVKEIAEAVKGRSTPPRFATCQLYEIIDNVFEALRLYAKERGVILHHRGLESLPSLRADQKRLFNAFYNLVNNAIPEVPVGGSITITGERTLDAQHILVRVIDTGRGMSAEVQKSLFTDQVLSRKPGGTGLGTKIVKDVVDVHGGTIEVDSREGQGTTFTICLPKDGPFAFAA